MILTDISLKRPVFATVTILALIVLGLVSYNSLGIDEWPNVEFPYVTVVIAYPGASPEQVDSKIVQKVEEAVSSISGVNHIYSKAKEGVAYTTIEFTLETPPNVAAQDVRDKIGKIRGDLPQGAEEPVIMRFDPNEFPIASLVVSGNLSVREMTTLVDELIKRRIETINGVGGITVQGERKREIAVNLDRDKIAAYGLTVSEVVGSLRGENLEVPGGKLTKGQREISLRTMGNLDSAADFLAIPVARKDGVQLYVGNIGTVADSVKEAETITKYNGVPAVGLDIMKQSGSNTVKVVEQIKKTVDALEKELPPGVTITLVRDNSKHIRESVEDVLFNLVVGGILAVLIVFLFLGNWRSTMISAVAIPASIISTFFVMKLFDFTLNTMSLLALSLAVGILIDDAIVVIENIVRHMEMGKDKFTAAADGTKEIGLAVTATTLTLVAVFVPVGMMTGIVGQFFRQFGITVAFAVLVSLFIAFTLTPMMAANYLDIAHGQKANILGKIIIWWNERFDRLTARYSRLLETALSHRFKIMAAALVLFLGSLALTPLLGSSFVGRADEGQFTVIADVDPGKSIEGADRLADQIIDIIRAVPEVNAVYSTTTVDSIRVFVKVGEKHERKRSVEQIMSDLRRQLAGVPGIKASIVEKAGLMEGKPVELVIKGESLDVLSSIAEEAHKIMETVPGAVDITSTYKPGKPDVQLVVKQQQAADLGVSTSAIADTVQTLFNGLTVGQFKDGDDRYDVRVRLKAEDRQDLASLHGIYLPGKYKDNFGQGMMVPLTQVAEIVYGTSPSEINRYDRQKEIRLSANLEGITLGDFNKKLKPKLEQLNMPAGYRFATIGESERMADTAKSMAAALFLAVVFIFFVLAAQFESYIDPFAIMLSLPLAIIGAILGLLVMKSELSLMSQIGIIMLMGLVTKNAILLVDFAKQRMAAGIDRNTALVEAAGIRMRPIMMTTAAMIFGMLPLAFGLGPGAESRAPMAHAIIGGLIVSTILTLVVVPVVYSLLDDLKKAQWLKRLFGKKLGAHKC